MGDHVFICYARTDLEFAIHLATRLKERGVPVWLDQWNIPRGANWPRAIESAIYNCAQVLVVLSPTAVESDRVQGEWLTALEENKPIVPVLYQPCKIPPLLRALQRVDFTARGPEEEAALEEVISVLGGAPNAHRQENRTSIVAEIRRGASEGVAQEQTPPARVRAPRTRKPRKKEISNSIGMELVLIPAGEFLMGSDEYESERPPHKVRISKPFYLGKYPVTQAQWETVMGNNPSHFKGDPNRPVEQVSWHDVQEFFDKLHEKEGGKPYRLPTEAEWEYAARAGTTTAYYFGNDESQLRKYAWYDKNAGGTTHPVGQLKPNAWGLYDMLGNVWEWCEDWYGETYYQHSPAQDPKGPDNGGDKVLRGGSWYYLLRPARVSYRYWYDPGYRNVYIGFRCAQ